MWQVREHEHVLIYELEQANFLKHGGAVVLRDMDQVRGSLPAWLAFNLGWQEEISCMQWLPKRRNVLAVGTKNGVCLWHISRGQVSYHSLSVAVCGILSGLIRFGRVTMLGLSLSKSVT